jgi:RNA polymerase sigma-70 factor (ECF subfamily)
MRDGSAAMATFMDVTAARVLEPEVAHHVVPSFDDLYVANVTFVWRIARALGVPDAALEDAVQDVFVVVHRKLPDFEARAAITTWLFAITRRVAATHRRRGDRSSPLEHEPVSETDTFAQVSRAQAAATVAAILEDLDDDKRVVFVLVELEQLSVPEVAGMLELNLNTTYSRLRLARRAFEAALRRRGLR